jgi:hypothetical protein
MKTKALAESVGKSVPEVLTLQKRFGLPRSADYPDGYVVLVKKLLYLSTCAVPDKDIKDLLAKEKKLLELLKVDSLQAGALWFEIQCAMKAGPTRLLFSGHDLGHPVQAPAIQTGLDFIERPRELFGSAEMGADVLRELQRYAEALGGIQQRVRQALPMVEAAAKWARRMGSVSSRDGI